MRKKIDEIKENLSKDANNYCPIIVSLDGVVLDGNHRVVAAREMGMKILRGVVIPLKVTEINLDDLTLGWQPVRDE